jgi:RNA polymerase sigma-70 factor, ECF subfamily
MDEDVELMRRGRSGDAAAFWQVAHRHRNAVYRVACGIVGVGDDAEDVVQDVFLRAFRAIHQYDTSRAPAAWLRAIAVNCSINACRRRTRNGHLVDSSHLAGLGGNGSTPEQHAVAGETWRRVRAAMETLSPRQRAVVTLSAFEDLEMAEIAETMGCSVATAKTHLHRARERLARSLDDA